MKKVFLTLSLVVLCFCGALAQLNFQTHYDFGRSLYNDDLGSRPKLTTTIENFTPDAWGSTFFFIDLDHTSNGISSAYFEIARELKFWEGPLSLHLEYNGGTSNQFTYNPCFLAGATYTYNNADFSKGFSVSAMYKYIENAMMNKNHNFQLTGVWHMNFCNGLYSFTGFADFWKEKKAQADYTFLSEPQFWVNLNKVTGVNPKCNLSVGSEVELSYGFYGDKFYAIPTLAAKWTF